MTAKIEFDVQMTCSSCTDKIKGALVNLEGVDGFEISLEKGSVLVETTLPSSRIQEAIESTGRRAVLKGYGSAQKTDTGGIALPKAAVAMIGGATGFSLAGVNGVVRMVQLDDSCVFDGTIDGLTPGKHGLHIHECGDISQGCESVGDHFDLGNATHGGPEDSIRHTGDLGNIEADDNGRAQFRIEDNVVKVWDVIGRSLVVTENQDDLGKGSDPMSKINGNSGRRLACGIISRSAGLFENSKKICACDGVTLWDERDRPLAGSNRRQPAHL